MKANKKITFLLIRFLTLSGLIFLLSSCQIPQGAVEIILPPKSSKSQQSSTVERRFQESAPQGPTVVESAMDLSEKYVKLSEETAVLRHENQNIITENRRLKDRVAVLETQLKQTQKELTEANDLLREMLIELNNWKTDIIGFRNEMRKAEKTQLKALFQILTVLGGEVKEESARNEDANSTAVSSAEPAQPKSQETQTSGESNE